MGRVGRYKSHEQMILQLQGSVKTGKGNKALQSWREQVACREELRSHLVQGVLNKINSGSVNEQKEVSQL